MLEIDRLLAHAVRQPLMLIKTDPSRERKVRAHAHEHPAPILVADIEVVLHDPAVGDLKMPAVELLVADCGHDPRGLSGFENDDYLIRSCALEVGVDKFVATASRRLNDRSVPLVGLLFHPQLKLFSRPAQDIPAHRMEVPIGTEKTHHSLGLLERLDKAVEQNSVKTPIAEADAVLVMFVERVHGRLP